MLLYDITFTTAYSQISMEIILFVVNLSWNKLNFHTHIHTHTDTNMSNAYRKVKTNKRKISINKK